MVGKDHVVNFIFIEKKTWLLLCHMDSYLCKRGSTLIVTWDIFDITNALLIFCLIFFQI